MTKKEAINDTALTEHEVTQIKRRVAEKRLVPILLAKGKNKKVKTELFRMAITDLMSCGNISCLAEKINALPAELNNATAELSPQTKVTLRVAAGALVAVHVTTETDEAFALRVAKAEERDDKILQRELYEAKKRKYLARTKNKKHGKR